MKEKQIPTLERQLELANSYMGRLVTFPTHLGWMTYEVKRVDTLKHSHQSADYENKEIMEQSITEYGAYSAVGENERDGHPLSIFGVHLVKEILDVNGTNVIITETGAVILNNATIIPIETFNKINSIVS